MRRTPEKKGTSDTLEALRKLFGALMRRELKEADLTMSKQEENEAVEALLENWADTLEQIAETAVANEILQFELGELVEEDEDDQEDD